MTKKLILEPGHWIPTEVKKFLSDKYEEASECGDTGIETLACGVLDRLANNKEEMEEVWKNLPEILPDLTASSLIQLTYTIWLHGFFNRSQKCSPAIQLMGYAATAKKIAHDLERYDLQSLKNNGISNTIQTDLANISYLFECEARAHLAYFEAMPELRKKNYNKNENKPHEIAFTNGMYDMLLKYKRDKYPADLVAILGNVAFDLAGKDNLSADKVRKRYHRAPANIKRKK